MRHSARSLPPRRRVVLACLGAAPAAVHASLRSPPAVRAPTAVQRLADALVRQLAGSGLPQTALGLYVAEVTAGRPLAMLNEERPFVLASTAKLVTSKAALDLLGPAWRWRTHAYTAGVLRGGALWGDLTIVGGGDPRLTSAELRQWFKELQTQGVQDIRGDLVVDRSAFLLHEQDHAGTPEPAPERPHHARPDALVLDGGQVPQAPAARGAPAAGRLGAVDARAAKGRGRGQPAATVPASLPAAAPAAVPADAAQAQAARALQLMDTLWRESGGRLRGRVRAGDVSAGRSDGARLPMLGPDGDPLQPLSTHLSPPLPVVVHEINKTSNNLAARHLLLSLARGFPARPATLASARTRVQEWLARQGFGPGDLDIDNGSGLSRAERGKPRALVHLLRTAWAGSLAPMFVESLPIAGVDGTLAHRLQGGAAMGHAFLKTGTLLDARALAGYVRAQSGTTYAAAVFVNHPEAARATPSIDSVIELLARHG